MSPGSLLGGNFTRPPTRVLIFSLLIVLYGMLTTLFSVVGIQLFSGGFFKNLFGLTVTILLIPLNLMWFASALGILQSKEWGIAFLVIAGPLISFAYFLLIMQYVFTGRGLTLNLASTVLLVTPILMVYLTHRLKIKIF